MLVSGAYCPSPTGGVRPPATSCALAPGPTFDGCPWQQRLQFFTLLDYDMTMYSTVRGRRRACARGQRYCSSCARQRVCPWLQGSTALLIRRPLKHTPTLIQSAWQPMQLSLLLHWI